VPGTTATLDQLVHWIATDPSQAIRWTDTPPVKVQKAFGHASLATTMKYTHLVRDDLRSLVEDESIAI
jgi:integrase